MDPPAAVPGQGNNNTSTSWDNHYNRRGQNREQFDYVNSSSFSGEQQQHQEQQQEQEQEQYSQQRPRRTHGADSRKNSNNSNKKYDSSSSSALPLSSPSRQKDNNDDMFCIGGSSPSRTGTGGSINVSYSDVGTSKELEERTDTFRYFDLPTYNAVVHDDSVLYTTSTGTSRSDTGVGTGRSTRSDIGVDTSTWSDALYRKQQDRGQQRRRVAPQDFSRSSQIQILEEEEFSPVGVGANTAGYSLRSSSNSKSKSQLPLSTINQRTGFAEQQQRNDHYYNYAKDNLIMFGGRGVDDSPTVSTGLSQEELLHRKRREDTWQKRKQKQTKRKNKNRILNLPSVLLHSSSSSSNNNNGHHQQNQNQMHQHHYQQHQLPHQPSTYYKNMATVVSLGGSSTGSNSPRKRMVIKGKGEYNGDEASTNSNNSRGKGVRGPMVRRQRDNASLGRRWSATKGIDKQMDPPIASNMPAAFVEDISDHNSRRCMGNSRGSKIMQNDKNFIQTTTKNNSTFQYLQSGNVPFDSDPNSNYQQGQHTTCQDVLTSSTKLNDDFDRFMEDPNMASANAKRGMSFDPKHDNTAYDYLSIPGIAGYSSSLSDVSTPTGDTARSKRPTYADFTPESDYLSRKLVLLKQQNKASPTSVMDVHDSSSMVGVRWNETLTQQEYILTPQSTKLRPDCDTVQVETPLGKPKSILRSRFKSQNKPMELDSSNECPSDEFARKQMKKVLLKEEDTNPIEITDEGFNTQTWTGFGDGFQKGNSLKNMPEHNVHSDDIFDPNFPVDDQEAGKFPESYVHFIEAVASVVIQTKIRQKLAKNKLRKLQNECLRDQNMPVSTQNNMTPMVRRSYALAQRMRSENKANIETRKDVASDFFALAAIQIQAAFRGWWVRDCLGVDNYCATMIQKIYLGYHCRNQFTINLYRVIVVQSICRRWLAMDDAVTRIYCIVRIQAFARGSLVRNRMKFRALENNVYDAAAIMIQTQWRSFWCEMNFLRAYEDILVVQSIVRGWITRRLIRSWLKANRIQTSRRLQGKLSKPGNDLPPVYSNHIEYMRNTLTPRTEEEQVTSPIISLDENKRNSGISNKEIRQLVPAHDAQCAAGFENDKTLESERRADIERRRKDKEFEVKAKQEEEQRRQEIQASEIAEIEFRRKRMALKAEARKREECKQIKPSSELTSVLEEESFPHDEEKKVNGDILVKDVNTKPIRAQLNGVAISEEVCANSERVSQKLVVSDTKIPKNSIRKHPAFSRKGGSLVASRMRQLLVSNGSAALTNESPSTVIDGEESVEDTNVSMNENEEKMTSSISILETDSTRSDDDEPREIQKTTVPDSPNLNIANEEVKDEIPKRSSRTSATYYQDYMRSQRSESEQKRIDDMHVIFGQAGLVSRVKCSSRANVEIEDRANLD